MGLRLVACISALNNSNEMKPCLVRTFQAGTALGRCLFAIFCVVDKCIRQPIESLNHFILFVV